jgi:hypothetical protein
MTQLVVWQTEEEKKDKTPERWRCYARYRNMMVMWIPIAVDGAA